MYLYNVFLLEIIFLFIGFSKNLEFPRAFKRAAEIKFNTRARWCHEVSNVASHYIGTC